MEPQSVSAASALELLPENGHHGPSQPPYGATVLFVKKTDGTTQVCVDIRALATPFTPSSFTPTLDVPTATNESLLAGSRSAVEDLKARRRKSLPQPYRQLP